MKKNFTIEEANALLPEIEQELIKLQEIKTDFEQKYNELSFQKEQAHMLSKKSQEAEDLFFQLETKLDFLQFEAQTHIRNILSKDILLKDIEQGLIDFPSKINNEDVLLCWKLGEAKDIKYYHGVDEGFIGRKHINESKNNPFGENNI